jgi:hypothetical protein
MSFTLESSTWKNHRSGTLSFPGGACLAFFTHPGFSGALKGNTPALLA